MQRPEFEAWDGGEPRDATGFLGPAWRETPPDSTSSPPAGFYADIGYSYGGHGHDTGPYDTGADGTGPYGIGEYANGGQPDQIRQRASMQAPELREAAEIGAAWMRRAVMSMQTELGEFAAGITDTRPNPVLPQTSPTEQPTVNPPRTTPPTPPSPTRPGARLTTLLLEVPAEEPTRRHGALPPGRHRARSAKRPKAGQGGRQVAGVRVRVVVTSAVFLVAAVAGVGVTEMYRHRVAFFASRATGTCETGPGGVLKDQGPGQPDAPSVKVQPSPHSTVTVQGHTS